MGRREPDRPDHSRIALAQEAARIIQEQGLDDFRSAKTKAALRLGLSKRGALPSNREIEQALAERYRIFRPDEQEEMLNALRRAALSIMQKLESFCPRLVGPVLSGHATEHSAIDLHLFSDHAEIVAENLESQGIKHSLIRRRHRTRHNSVQEYPGYRFFSAGFGFETTVFPERSRGHAPLSSIDGRPMRRAKLKDVRALLHSGCGDQRSATST